MESVQSSWSGLASWGSKVLQAGFVEQLDGGDPSVPLLLPELALPSDEGVEVAQARVVAVQPHPVLGRLHADAGVVAPVRRTAMAQPALVALAILDFARSPAALLAPRHQIPDIGGASCAERLAVAVALRTGSRAIMGIRLAMRIPEPSRAAPEIARRAALTIDAIGIDRRHRNYLWGEFDNVGYVANALVPPAFGLVEVKFEEDDKGQILSLQAPRRAAIPAVAIDREPRLLTLLPALDVAGPNDRNLVVRVEVFLRCPVRNAPPVPLPREVPLPGLPCCCGYVAATAAAAAASAARQLLMWPAPHVALATVERRCVPWRHECERGLQVHRMRETRDK
eukprot:scaffold96871_cov75-Phaeocystis_antarctica.AAC.1